MFCCIIGLSSCKSMDRRAQKRGKLPAGCCGIDEDEQRVWRAVATASRDQRDVTHFRSEGVLFVPIWVCSPVFRLVTSVLSTDLFPITAFSGAYRGNDIISIPRKYRYQPVSLSFVFSSISYPPRSNIPTSHRFTPHPQLPTNNLRCLKEK